MRIGVGVVDVAGKGHGIPGFEGDHLVVDLDGDRALQHVHQFLGAGGMSLAGVAIPGPQRPVPQLDDIRGCRAGHQHTTPAGRAAP